MNGIVGWVGGGGVSVPTLSGAMLLLLALLVAVITVRALRTKGAGGRASSVLLIAGAAAALSFMAVDDTRSSAMGVLVDNPDCRGGEARFDAYSTSDFTNGCPNTITIIRLEAACDGGELFYGPGSCRLNDTYANGESCVLPRCRQG